MQDEAIEDTSYIIGEVSTARRSPLEFNSKYRFNVQKITVTSVRLYGNLLWWRGLPPTNELARTENSSAQLRRRRKAYYLSLTFHTFFTFHTILTLRPTSPHLRKQRKRWEILIVPLAEQKESERTDFTSDAFLLPFRQHHLEVLETRTPCKECQQELPIIHLHTNNHPPITLLTGLR